MRAGLQDSLSGYQAGRTGHYSGGREGVREEVGGGGMLEGDAILSKDHRDDLIKEKDSSCI